MTLRLCGTTAESLDWAKITFERILASLPTENVVFHHFSVVPFWCPNQSFRSRRKGFIKLAVSNGILKMVKFGKWINSFYWWDISKIVISFAEFATWDNERRKVNIRADFCNLEYACDMLLWHVSVMLVVKFYQE